MRLITKDELKLLTEAELWELYRRLLWLLSALLVGSYDHTLALMNVQIIRERLSEQYRLRLG